MRQRTGNENPAVDPGEQDLDTGFTFDGSRNGEVERIARDRHRGLATGVEHVDTTRPLPGLERTPGCVLQRGERSLQRRQRIKSPRLKPKHRGRAVIVGSGRDPEPAERLLAGTLKLVPGDDHGPSSGITGNAQSSTSARSSSTGSGAP